MVKSIKVNKTDLSYEDKWDVSNLNEYYQYILNNLIGFFKINNVPLSVNFGCDSLIKDINLEFQYEHTIIKSGIDYLCSIYRVDYLSKCDLVFEYSNANVTHIKNFTEYTEYSNVCRYYPPLLYEITETYTGNRFKNCLTIHNPSPRRHNIHQKIDMDYYHAVCEGDLYDKDIMRKTMNNYKLLINIHQTDFSHTLEELRVLPSLMSGILLISEDVPYKESIPYSKHIIWSQYNNLVDTINDVLNNYEYYREKYLHNLNETLLEMKLNSDNVINTFFKNHIV